MSLASHPLMIYGILLSSRVARWEEARAKIGDTADDIREVYEILKFEKIHR